MMQQLCGSKQVFCINSQPYQAVKALEAHKSQYVWYDVEITAKLWACVQHLCLMATLLAGIDDGLSDFPVSHM